MSSKKYKTVRENAVPTAGEIFNNDVIVEIIRAEGRNGSLRLLTWNGRQATAVDRVTVSDVTYVPLALNPTVGRALLLPSGAIVYGSTRQLFQELSRLVSRVTRLPESVATQIIFFAFATWFADRLPVAPFLWITAPPTVSTGPLLQLLALLCRSALMVTEPTAATLRSLPVWLRPTIVTEVSTMTSALLKALRASNRRGTLAVAGDELLDIYCAKVVISTQTLRDPAIVGFPLEIVLPPSREYVPQLDSQEVGRLASEFQGKLLMYRLANYAKVTAPSFDLSGFTAPTQELAYVLGACIVGDRELQAQIVPLLKERDHEIQVDRSSLLEAIVIEALWAACHDSTSGDLSVTELTKSVNTILVGRGEPQEVSPETVGWKLRGLGLRTDFITGGRKGLKLPNEIRAVIHTLAAAYGVRVFQQKAAIEACSICAASRTDRKTA